MPVSLVQPERRIRICEVVVLETARRPNPSGMRCDAACDVGCSYADAVCDPAWCQISNVVSLLSAASAMAWGATQLGVRARQQRKCGGGARGTQFTIYSVMCTLLTVRGVLSVQRGRGNAVFSVGMLLYFTSAACVFTMIALIVRLWAKVSASQAQDSRRGLLRSFWALAGFMLLSFAVAAVLTTLGIISLITVMMPVFFTIVVSLGVSLTYYGRRVIKTLDSIVTMMEKTRQHGNASRSSQTLRRVSTVLMRIAML